MTRKDRSKVRAREADDPPKVLPLGAVPIERLTPEELVERYPEPPEPSAELAPEDPRFDSPAARATLTDWLPALPAPVSELEPDEGLVQGIIEKIESSPGVRDAIARLMATNAAITESNAGQEPSAFVLEPLWVDRLHQMATAARQSPSQYLQTLLARAWTAMPRRSRE